MAKEKQTVIHFIGHDNSGKSSIAKALSHELRIPYFCNPHNAQYHSGNNNISYLHAEGLLEFHLLSECGFSLIRDRNYICEIVYSAMYNRETDIEFIHSLHKAYCTFPNFSIIYCYKEQFREKFEDEYVKEEEIFGLKALYGAAIKLLPHQEKVLWLDTTNEDLGHQIKTIKEFIKWDNQ